MPANRIRPWIVLVLLWAAYFHPLLLQPAGTLYTDYSDLASEHLPSRIFLVREWRTTGELPLWNPYHFCGSPFIHDIQVGAFYPPYMLTLLFHENNAGAVMSWVIALHVLLASAFGYIYGRRHGLGEAGSLVAGIGFAYSAKWMTHLILAGHTITIGLAWLPLVLLGLESFIRTKRLLGLLGGGTAFALLTLGTHPQWTFYSGLFIAAWTWPGKEKWVRWLAGGIGIVTIAGLLAAVQLLPTWEASHYSTRTTGLASSQSLTTGVYSFLLMFGPSAEYNPPRSWELQSLLSLFGLGAAIAAPLLIPALRWKRTVLFAMLVFSFGGAVLIEWLPGFNLFRSAARMLVIAAFPVAFLAAASTHELIAAAWERSKARSVLRCVLIAALAGGLTSPAVTVLMWSRQRKDLADPGAMPMWPDFGLYWGCVAAGLAAAGAAGLAPKLTPRTRTGLWLSAMLLELLAPTILRVEVKPQADIYPESDLVKFLNANTDPGSSRVIDIEMGSLSLDRLAPLGIGSPQALTNRIAMPRGYNPLDLRHYREYLNFVMNEPGPVVSLSPIAQPIVPNFPREVQPLWEQLNVRYLVCYDDYITNPVFTGKVQMPFWGDILTLTGHNDVLFAADWRYTTQFRASPLIPEIPPIKPDKLQRVLVMESVRYTNHPRAFVVPDSAPMPPGTELNALGTTDLHKTVLLTDGPATQTSGGAYRPAPIREYGANRAVIDLGGGTGGWLVLNDVWFPGWTCRIDGAEVPVHRANHTFRAVPVPAGAKEAVFRFEPPSYLLGWNISAVSLGLTVIAGLGLLIRSRLDSPQGAG